MGIREDFSFWGLKRDYQHCFNYLFDYLSCFYYMGGGGDQILSIGAVCGKPGSCINFSKSIQSMGDLSSSFEPSMDQSLMQLERWLQE